jgi:hypothetical protein
MTKFYKKKKNTVNIVSSLLDRFNTAISSSQTGPLQHLNFNSLLKNIDRNKSHNLARGDEVEPRKSPVSKLGLGSNIEPATPVSKDVSRPRHSSGGESPASHRGGPRSKPGLVMWDFVMDKSGAGAGFLRELRFPLQSTFHLLLHNHLHYHPRLAQ